MPNTPEVFLRDVERHSDEAERAWLTVLLAYLAARNREDDEDDSALLLFFRGPVTVYALTLLALIGQYADAEGRTVDVGAISDEAVLTAVAAFRDAISVEPSVLSGQADPRDPQRFSNILASMVTSVRSQVLSSAARDLGYMTKTWRTRLDGKVRTAHRILEGRTVPLDGTFVTVGGKLRFPGDRTAHPSLWINCRCLLQFGTRSTIAPVSPVSPGFYTADELRSLARV